MASGLVVLWIRERAGRDAVSMCTSQHVEIQPSVSSHMPPLSLTTLHVPLLPGRCPCRVAPTGVNIGRSRGHLLLRRRRAVGCSCPDSSAVCGKRQSSWSLSSGLQGAVRPSRRLGKADYSMRLDPALDASPCARSSAAAGHSLLRRLKRSIHWQVQAMVARSGVSLITLLNYTL